MMNISKLLGICLLILICGSCTPSAKSGETTQGMDAVSDSLDFAFPVRVEYAQGFSVQNHDTHKELVIYTPGTLDTAGYYVLYPRWTDAPHVMSSKAKLIPVPALTLACNSSTEIGALSILKIYDKLIACSNPHYVNDTIVQRRIKEGYVQGIGRGMSRDVESLIGLHPEIYLQDVYSATDKDEDIMASGINIVYYNNWKERNLLGRAEWFKVMAMLFGRNELADKAFQDMVLRYEEARKLTEGVTEIVPIMYGKDYKGVWHLPGEYAYITNLFADAKVAYDYVPGELDNRPTSFEYIFANHRHKKLWLCLMTGELTTLEDFLSLNERYRHFDAAKEGNIWVDRKRVNENGGNDFWESGPYHPDLLLKDIIKIAHPDLLPEYETVYWTKLTND
ncbi:ABC transporter substrate-binding protein [Porphyromonas cangingivalis]|uniref:ABC transporter substrate-binding protein n=1 Tax=Porphyromonas cangingivalis TaxID=36874 RepID=UPI000A652C38|nr:ABC transporter substrate-binding protein [Porphyromonas cangingivalis]